MSRASRHVSGRGPLGGSTCRAAIPSTPLIWPRMRSALPVGRIALPDAMQLIAVAERRDRALVQVGWGPFPLLRLQPAAAAITRVNTSATQYLSRYGAP